MEVIPLAGDASLRLYFRVIVDDTSYALMSWEPFIDNDEYPFLSVLQHFEKHQIGVPKVKAKSPDLGLILLEDLGDLTLERKFWENQNQKMALPLYQQAIDELIKIHYPASFDKNDCCTAFKIAFDKDKFLWEMNYGRKHLLETLAGTDLNSSESRMLDAVFDDVCDRLDKEDKLISHRDFHSRNLMIKLGKMRVIDFQDARLGPIQYDLVSLVHDSYVDLNEEMRHLIIQYYLQKSAEYRNQLLHEEHFYEIFAVQTIQRCFKACGSFASFFNSRQDTRYLHYIRPTIYKVYETLELFPSYKGFRDIIEERGLLEREFDKECTP